MNPRTEADALKMILDLIIEKHPNRRHVLTQIDGLIAEMQVNAEGSPQLQAADPLRRAVEAFRATLGDSGSA